MTGLEKIVSQILDDANKEAEAILAKATAQSETILKKAQEECAKMEEDCSRRSEETAKAYMERIHSSAQLKKRQAILLAKQQEIVDGKIDTSKVKAFRCPAGTGIEVYATTLHYAPCSAKKGQGFRVIVVLPKGTNTDKPEIQVLNTEDAWITARNKWLLAHPDADEAKQGAYVGITGKNIDIADCI